MCCQLLRVEIDGLHLEKDFRQHFMVAVDREKIVFIPQNLTLKK